MISWPEILNVRGNTVLAPHTSWLIGGPADFFSEPKNMEQLSTLQEICLAHKIPVTLLGGGTNVLVGDKGIRGMVVSLSQFSGIEIISEKKELKFWAMTGTPKSELLKIFLRYKLAPARFLGGLPGQVGGGVVMNAGVSEKLTPREFHEITEAVEVLRPDGRVEIILADKLQWAYRHCQGWQPGIITRVKISWTLDPDPQLIDEVRKLNQSRLQKQPLEWPSCGSVFRNPLPRHAGQLIESCGLKGHTEGNAQISEKHANFIVNKGNASARDVRTLINLCVQRVKENCSVDLHSEVIYLGEF